MLDNQQQVASILLVIQLVFYKLGLEILQHTDVQLNF